MTEYPGLELTHLNEEEIMRRIGDVSRRLSRPVLRSDISSQLQFMLATLRGELEERNFKKAIQSDKKWQAGVVLDTGESKDNKDRLDKLIDIT